MIPRRCIVATAAVSRRDRLDRSIYFGKCLIMERRKPAWSGG
jgi:hypothetical protein